MKLTKNCYQCLDNLILQAAGLATKDNELKTKAIEQGREILKSNFSVETVSIVVATKIHDVIKRVTQNQDPYYYMKQEEIQLARELYREAVSRSGNTFSDLLKLAVLGNNLDFFRPFEEIRKDMKKEVFFTIDDSEYFEMRLKKSKKVLYLADNAGEVYFDLPLIKWMNRFTQVTYVVKERAVQNDITFEDLKRTGLESELGRVINTGTATPGIILEEASNQFKKEYEAADVIIAKGMGYYESLSEFTATGKVFYCLKAKCQPVADSLEVPLDAFVAMFC